LQDADAERGKPVADQRFWARYCRFYYRELPTVREELSAHGQELLGVEPLRPVSEAVLRRALVAARA
jgi:hypothetical protein